jgi:hypothetical protein
MASQDEESWDTLLPIKTVMGHVKLGRPIDRWIAIFEDNEVHTLASLMSLNKEDIQEMFDSVVPIEPFKIGSLRALEKVVSSLTSRVFAFPKCPPITGNRGPTKSTANDNPFGTSTNDSNYSHGEEYNAPLFYRMPGPLIAYADVGKCPYLSKYAELIGQGDLCANRLRAFNQTNCIELLAATCMRAASTEIVHYADYCSSLLPFQTQQMAEVQKPDGSNQNGWYVTLMNHKRGLAKLDYFDFSLPESWKQMISLVRPGSAAEQKMSKIKYLPVEKILPELLPSRDRHMLPMLQEAMGDPPDYSWMNPPALMMVGVLAHYQHIHAEPWSTSSLLQHTASMQSVDVRGRQVVVEEAQAKERVVNEAVRARDQAAKDLSASICAAGKYEICYEYSIASCVGQVWSNPHLALARFAHQRYKVGLVRKNLLTKDLSYVKAYKGADPPVKVRQIDATEAPAAAQTATAQTAATAQEAAQEAAAKEAATQDNDDEKCPCCEGHMEAWRTLCLHCEAYFDAEAHFEADNDIMGSEGGGAAAEDGLETDEDATSKAAKSAGEKLSLETITDKGKIGACFAN